MFKFANNVDFNKISNTGARGLILLALLSVKPRSLKELRNAFIDCGVMNNNNSDDIIRIDINTLRHAGCEISRNYKEGKYYFNLDKNQFAIELNKEDVECLKKVYNRAKKDLDIIKLLEFDDFFIKIANQIIDEEIKEQILGISELKHYNKELLREIYFACGKNYQLMLSYMRISSNTIVYKNITAQKIVIQNNKIYLYGYDNDIKKSTVLNFKRIKGVFARVFGCKEKETNIINIKFYLKDDFIDSLNENEIIIETIGDTYLIEANYYNEFYAMQRILSFGKNCKVLEPEDFKERIITKIKEMRDVYDD